MRMKVLLVDDEPFILQGLSMLIDWEAEGFEIVKKAADGKEALEFLRENKVDLIFADIQMPVMTGLELLKRLREEELNTEAYFVILSGYNDFSYAQSAMRYSCMDYLLKPVQKEVLLELLHKVASEKEITIKKEDENRKLEHSYLQQNLGAILLGKGTDADISYVKESMRLSNEGDLRYIHISLNNLELIEELESNEVRRLREQLCENLAAFLGEDADHLFGELPSLMEDYEIGFLFCDSMAEKRGMTEKEFLSNLQKAGEQDLKIPVVLLAGKKVSDISRIAHAYSTACMLRPFKGFRAERAVYYYEEEIQAEQNKVVLCKQNLDRLLAAVEQNDRAEINSSVDALYQEMEAMGMERELVNMNINYLLFQMIHLAVSQDEDVNQEEVLFYISENVPDARNARGSRAHLRHFACEYAEYLIQLRKNVSKGVLLEVEKEIKEHYAENLTLKGLSQKYFVNSSYLGQIFRKKYGISFKDYLNSYRINEAASMLLKTEDKISSIAEAVGYRDTDYFISRFIEAKGCTPAKYRRNAES